MASYGYVRQSRRADLDTALSAETQINSIKRLAQRYGDDPDSLVILSDLGRSGAKEKGHLRHSYQELVRAIEQNGHGTTIYALSMSRLARSLTELTNIFSLASAHGVRIVFEKEGEVRFDTPIGKLHATITGAVYEFERELAVERQRDNVAIRKARGDRMGRIPYDNPDAVLGTYLEAMSYNGTATLLNQRKVPSWSGKPWGPSGVKSVLRRIDPSLVVKTGHGRKARSADFRLFRILLCHCGATLTGYHNKGKPYYRCHKADGNPDHPRPAAIAESRILPAFEAEVGDLVNLIMVVDTPIDQERVKVLSESRSRVVEAFIDGVVGKAERDERLAKIDTDLASLQTKEKVLPVPHLDEEPKGVNIFLRDLFGTVQLNEKFEPTFEWKIDVKVLRDKIPEPAVLRMPLDKKANDGVKSTRTAIAGSK